MWMSIVQVFEHLLVTLVLQQVPHSCSRWSQLFLAGRVWRRCLTVLPPSWRLCLPPFCPCDSCVRLPLVIPHVEELAALDRLKLLSSVGLQELYFRGPEPVVKGVLTHTSMASPSASVCTETVNWGLVRGHLTGQVFLFLEPLRRARQLSRTWSVASVHV